MSNRSVENSSGIKINIILNGIVSLSSMLFPLITFPYTSRVLGVEVNGAISFASSVVDYFALFAALGLSTYGVNACAQVRNDKKKLSKVAHELLIISSVTASIMFICLLASMFLIAKFEEYRLFMLVYSFNILFNVVGMNWLYQAIERFKYITTRSIVFKLISVLMMFTFVKGPEDGGVYAAISVLASVGGNLLNIINSRKYIFFHRVGSYSVTKHIKPTLYLFATTLAVNIYSHMDSVMLGFFQNDYAVGIYYVSVKVKTLLLALVSSFSIVIMSRLSYINTGQNKEELFRILKKSYSFILLIAVPVCLFFIIFAKESVLFLSGNDYLNAAKPMRILMPVLIISSISQILGSQYSVSTGKERNLMIAVVSGACVNVFLNILLIPRYSYIGAAIGTLTAEMVQCVIQMVLARTVVKKVFSLQKLYMVLFSSSCAGIASYVFYLMFQFKSSLVTLFINAIIFMGLYLIILLMMKYDICCEIWVHLMHTVKKGGRYGRLK